MLGQEATPAERDRLREQLGLNEPVFVQFYHFVLNALQGDFGLSLRQGQKVSRLLAERLPATLELSFAAAALALVVGLPLGVYTALRRHGALSQLLLGLSLLPLPLPGEPLPLAPLPRRRLLRRGAPPRGGPSPEVPWGCRLASRPMPSISGMR